MKKLTEEDKKAIYIPLELQDLVEEFIAEHEYNNPHYLFDKEIIKYFSDCYKIKHIKKAIKDVR